MSQYFLHFNRKLGIINFTLQWHRNHNIALEADLKGQVWQHKCKCALPVWKKAKAKMLTCLLTPNITLHTFRQGRGGGGGGGNWSLEGFWMSTLHVIHSCVPYYTTTNIYLRFKNVHNGWTVGFSQAFLACWYAYCQREYKHHQSSFVYLSWAYISCHGWCVTVQRGKDKRGRIPLPLLWPGALQPPLMYLLTFWLYRPPIGNIVPLEAA